MEVRVGDGSVPRIWTWLLVATLTFGGGYLLVSLVMQEQWGARASWERAADAELAGRTDLVGDLHADRATFERIAASPALRDLGRGVFAAHCAGCHGARGGGGLLAPNLTDDFYLHVRTIEDIHDVIALGRRNGAMPAWRDRLPPADQILVAGYVAALKGTNLPGGKAAEGARIGPL